MQTAPASVRVLATLSAALVMATSVRAQEKPNFAGRWTLDPQATVTMGGGRGDSTGNATGGGGAAGGGAGLGPPAQALTVQQDDATVRVEERRSDDNVVSIVYRLDGKKSKNAMPIGRGRTTEAVYVSHWDGSTLVTSIIRSVRTRGNTFDIKYREQRYVAPDGTMVVETTMVGRSAGRRAVYRKAG